MTWKDIAKKEPSIDDFHINFEKIFESFTYGNFARYLDNLDYYVKNEEFRDKFEEMDILEELDEYMELLFEFEGKTISVLRLIGQQRD